jgi:hypothetical protein
MGLVGEVTRGKSRSAPEDEWTRVASQRGWVGGYVRVQLCSRAHVCYIGVSSEPVQVHVTWPRFLNATRQGSACAVVTSARRRCPARRCL